MPDFRMPSLGADMDVGTVLEWLVQPGDTVHRGDVVAVVDTAKAAVEVETFDDGVLGEILVPVGREVPVGTPLARLEALPDGSAAASATPAAPAPSSSPASAVPPEPAAAPAATDARTPAPRPEAPVASPLVRHLAHQRGVDLRHLAGTGAQGTVTRDDVERAAAGRKRVSPYARRRARELGVPLDGVDARGRDGVVRAEDVMARAVAGPPAPAAQQPALVPSEPCKAGPVRSSVRDLRRAVGDLMARSKREVPHYYLSTTVDLHAALTWLRELNRTRDVTQRVLPVALLLKATAASCRDVPALNGTWQQGRFVPATGVHLGIAVALRGGGLVAPALHEVDERSIGEVMEGLQDLVARARAGRLRRAELTDGTLTVTNLGDRGVDEVLGVLFPPQVALVGFGRVADRPCAVDGMLAVRPCVTASLSADHRATDGHTGARFLNALDGWLQRPHDLEESRGR